MRTAQDGGRLSALRTGRLYPQEMLRKTVPLQAWSGPEGSRKLRFPDFVTTAQDGGKVVSLTHRLPLAPENAPYSSPVTGLDRPRGLKEVKVPRFRDNGKGWW